MFDRWFCKLRKFLSNSPTWSHVCIDFQKFNEINLNNLQLDHMGLTPLPDVLNVYCTRLGREYPAFVDALLWSCHPRRLNLQQQEKHLHFSLIIWLKAYKFDRRKRKVGMGATRNLKKVEKWGFKVRLHNRTPSIDILSECLIHKILCCLSFKEATRMSILSKTWLQAWLNLPNLDFTVDFSKGNDMKIVDDIMGRYRDGKIPIEKFELSDDRLFFENSHEVLVVPMIDKWLGIVLTNGVKDLTISSYPLFIFAILAVVVNCNSLRKLCLFYVRLDENMLQALLNSCPLTESFIFEYCKGLETMNPQKIKSVSLKFLKIRFCGGIWEIDAPNLLKF
ncbi:hypothetical protein H5410_047974 [Solanum commersonii]|uniref:F-box domain-containing protein n=1 Tax=Solanum commersonii TaxID=4109 RepID=A0A9J5XJS9_SOLCO|nr:hypothetical protein H5410_047974 [Solanum commersonii]